MLGVLLYSSRNITSQPIKAIWQWPSSSGIESSFNTLEFFIVSYSRHWQYKMMWRANVFLMVVVVHRNIYEFVRPDLLQRLSSCTPRIEAPPQKRRRRRYTLSWIYFCIHFNIVWIIFAAWAKCVQNKQKFEKRESFDVSS